MVTCKHCLAGRSCPDRTGPRHGPVPAASYAASLTAPSIPPAPAGSVSDLGVVPDVSELPQWGALALDLTNQKVALHHRLLLEAEERMGERLDLVGAGDALRDAVKGDPTDPAHAHLSVDDDTLEVWYDVHRQRLRARAWYEQYQRQHGYLTGPHCTSPAGVLAAAEDAADQAYDRVRTARVMIEVAGASRMVVEAATKEWYAVADGRYKTVTKDLDPDVVNARTVQGKLLATSWCAPAGFDPEEAEVYRAFRRDGMSVEDAALFARVV